MSFAKGIFGALAAVVRFLIEFINPRRTARAVPMGRIVILTVFVAAVSFVAYSLTKDRFKFPFVSERYYVEAEFLNVAGLDEDNEPPVSVAGVPAGKVVEVRYDAGRAIVRMELDEEMRGKVFGDASARTRPLNGANILSVNITPGAPEAGWLEETERIPVSRTSIPVATDEALSIFDADTRAYLQLITGEAAIALRGRGGEVALALREVGDLSDSALQISRAFKRNRELAQALIGEMNTIFATFAKRRDELNAALEAGAEVLEAYGDQDEAIAEGIRELPGLLADTRETVSLLREAAPGFSSSLASLEPAVAALGPALEDARELVPDFRDLLEAADSLGRTGLGPATQFGALIDGFAASTGEIVTGLGRLYELVTALDGRRGEIRRLADVIPGVASIQDAISPIGRVVGIGIEAPKPENLGFAPGSAGEGQMSAMLTEALDRTCTERGSLACLIRFLTPGLPGSVELPLDRSGLEWWR